MAFPLPDYAHQLTSALIEALGAAVQQDGARLVVLGDMAGLDGLDVAAFDHQGILVVRPDEQLNRGNERVRFRNDGHFTPLGHRRIAEALVPALLDVYDGDRRRRVEPPCPLSARYAEMAYAHHLGQR